MSDHRFSVVFPMLQLAQDCFISYNMTGCQSHSSSYRYVSISILGPYIQELIKLIMEWILAYQSFSQKNFLLEKFHMLCHS